MTEHEWLTSSALHTMLHFVGSRGTDRKLRLFKAACCRRILYVLADQSSLEVISALELYADGVVGAMQLKHARLSNTEEGIPLQVMLTAAESYLHGVEGALTAADWATVAVGEVVSGHFQTSAARRSEERARQCELLRDIIGNPFHPATVDPVWLGWKGGVVVQLAQSIYDERAFDLMPILADALEDAGCTEEDVLKHCRQPAEHVRGCWVIDALLGKG